MVNRITMSGNDFVNNIEDYSTKIVGDKIRSKFGQELLIPIGLTKGADPNNKIMKFFKKFIKDFTTKYTYVQSGELINDFICISPLDKSTFIYVSSGIYNPNGKLYLMSNINNDRGGNYASNMLYVYIFGKHYKKYHAMLTKCIDIENKKTRNQSIYVVNAANDDRTDISLLNLTNRDVESLVYSFDETGKIVKFIDKFIADIDYYKSKQLNYKTGILLYSEPGTGKSSLVKALACKYHRSICQINMANIDKINFNDITGMINAETEEQYIVLFEDIDTLYLNRSKTNEDGEEEADSKAKDFQGIINGLLQFLDSNSSPNNVIFIATTNHVERLDEALIRDGRFDLKVEIKALEEKEIPRFMKVLDYNGSAKEIVEEYGTPNKDGLYNQSKLQNIIISKRK